TLDVTLRPNTLSGTITDSYSKQPLANVQVQASDTISATTDAEGRYTLAGVPENVSLTMTAPDYDEATGSAQRTTTFDGTLRPNFVEGVVTDKQTGEPVAGATVKAGSASATTDAEGRYRLTGVEEGSTVEISTKGYDAATGTPDATTLDLALRSNMLTGTITDEYTSQPLEGVLIKTGSVESKTDSAGRFSLEGVAENAVVAVSVEGYADVEQKITELKPLELALRPDVLQGKLVDATTAQPIKNAAVLVALESNGTDVAFTRIKNSTDGAFTLDGAPEQGFLKVLAPGYKKFEVELKVGEIPETIELEPFAAKALYITAAVASAGTDYVAQYFDAIDNTELNTIIVDLKSDLRDDLGLVYYDSQTPMVKELKTSADYVDMPAFVAEAKKRGIYTIARIQLFSHDNALADARPDWAIKDGDTGEVYADRPGPGIRYAWLDPWNQNVWDYNIALAVEAAQMGFDEINYDYIRYPDSSDLATYGQEYIFSQPTDPKNNPEAMYNNIAQFMEKAHRATNGAGAFMSVDVFGRVSLKASMPISQDISRMAEHSDFVAPMIYPSLWWVGYLDFANPTAHPYEVILGTLKSADLLFEGKYALQRPWLQDHTDPWQGSRVIEYGAKEVRAQIDATEDFGKASGWMLYDSANTYTDGALKPE
ncbi:MAG: glycoside hydrolase, partial [uncultured Chloroflexia bacterium]